MSGPNFGGHLKLIHSYKNAHHNFSKIKVVEDKAKGDAKLDAYNPLKDNLPRTVLDIGGTIGGIVVGVDSLVSSSLQNAEEKDEARKKWNQSHR